MRYQYNPTDDNKEIFSRIENIEFTLKRILQWLERLEEKKVNAPIPFVKPDWMKYE